MGYGVDAKLRWGGHTTTVSLFFLLLSPPRRCAVVEPQLAEDFQNEILVVLITSHAAVNKSVVRTMGLAV